MEPVWDPDFWRPSSIPPSGGQHWELGAPLALAWCTRERAFGGRSERLEKNSQTATPKAQAAKGRDFLPELQEVLSIMAEPNEG